MSNWSNSFDEVARPNPFLKPNPFASHSFHLSQYSAMDRVDFLIDKKIETLYDRNPFGQINLPTHSSRVSIKGGTQYKVNMFPKFSDKKTLIGERPPPQAKYPSARFEAINTDYTPYQNINERSGYTIAEFKEVSDPFELTTQRRTSLDPTYESYNSHRYIDGVVVELVNRAARMGDPDRLNEPLLIKSESREREGTGMEERRSLNSVDLDLFRQPIAYVKGKEFYPTKVNRRVRT